MLSSGDAPACGVKGNMLGVRPSDIADDASGNVRPSTGGMSVSSSEATLPPHARPRRFRGGNGMLPVFEIDSSVISAALSLSWSTTTHGVVEPARIMTRGDFLSFLCSTGPEWKIV